MENDLELNKTDPSFALLQIDSDKNQEDDSLSSREVGKSHYRLAKIHYDKSDLDLAEQYFLSAYKVAERPGDTYTMFKILGFLLRIASEKLEDD